MATDPADVLIVGAGASGGVVALRLAQAGFKVVCLEQGEWLDRKDYPGDKLDWELQGPQGLGDEPEHPRPRVRLPDRRGGQPGLAAHVQRGRRLDDHLRRRLAARPAVRLPGPLARRRRRRLADQLLRAAALLLPDRPRLRCLRPGRRPGLSAGHRGPADAAAADRLGRDEGRARHDEARLALVARVQLDQLGRLRRASPVRPARAPASRAATKAPRPRPTSPTGPRRSPWVRRS